MARPIHYRWELLIWLWLAFFFNQADRQVFAVVLPQLKVDLHLTDVQAGLIASIFTAALALTVPFAGYAGDALNRRWLISGSLFGWSLSTLLTGFAGTLMQLIGVRSVATAVGEAVYAPAANAVIGEHHKETRAQAMAIHQTSLYCGVVVSGLISGWIADHFGWRAAFFGFGVGGVILSAILAIRLRDSRSVHPSGRPQVREILAIARTRPTFPLLTLGFTALVFVNVGYLTWMPTYLHETFGQSLAEAGFSSMFYHHLFAFAGVLLGGRLSDRVALTNPRYRLFVQSGGMLLGAPFIWLTGAASSALAVYAALGAFGFFRGFYECNIYTTVFEVVEPRFHASASGIMICFAFLTGAAAPVGLGAIKQASGLAHGISALSGAYGLGGLAVLAAALLFFDRDHNKVKYV